MGDIILSGSNADVYLKNININTSKHIFALDWVGGTNPIYIGLAAPGSTTSSPVWQIRKFTYDGSGNLLSVLYAGGTAAYTSVYDDRASLSYS